MAGADALAAMIRRCRAMRTLAVESAKEAAPLIEAAARRTATAGTTPSGTTWQARKDGGRPLVNAAQALSARPLGAAVVVLLLGVEVFHHFGKHGLPKRQILPDGGAGLPKGVADAAREGARRAFLRLSGGAS